MWKGDQWIWCRWLNSQSHINSHTIRRSIYLPTDGLIETRRSWVVFWGSEAYDHRWRLFSSTSCCSHRLPWIVGLCWSVRKCIRIQVICVNVIERRILMTIEHRVKWTVLLLRWWWCAESVYYVIHQRRISKCIVGSIVKWITKKSDEYEMKDGFWWISIEREVKWMSWRQRSENKMTNDTYCPWL